MVLSNLWLCLHIDPLFISLFSLKLLLHLKIKVLLTVKDEDIEIVIQLLYVLPEPVQRSDDLALLDVIDVISKPDIVGLFSGILPLTVEELAITLPKARATVATGISFESLSTTRIVKHPLPPSGPVVLTSKAVGSSPDPPATASVAHQSELAFEHDGSSDQLKLVLV